MIRRFFLLAICALLIVCLAPPAFAARLVAENEGFSAELPKGWTVREEDAQVSFESGGKKPQTIFCETIRLENFSLDVYLERQAKDGKWGKLDGLSYVYVAHSGARCWFGIVGPGELFEIVVDEPIKALPGFLRSLQTTEETREYRTAFMDAGSQAVVDWLTFTMPEPPAGPAKKKAPAQPGKVTLKPFAGSNLKAEVPDGWTIETKGQYVTFTAPEGPDGGFAVGASIPLHGKFSVDVGMAIIDELGGVNVRDVEGTLGFQLGNDRNGLFTQYGDTLLLIIYQFDNTLSANLANSIELLEW